MKTKSKKQKFEMEIVRTKREFVKVTVSADTEEDAYELAIEKATSKKPTAWKLLDEDYETDGPFSHP